MPVRTARASWDGRLKDGEGFMRTGSGAVEGNFSFGSRFEEAGGTNPEELIGAAHAGCFSMALAFELEQAGYKPERVATSAKVHIDRVKEGFKITAIDLETEALVPGVGEKKFQEIAEKVKKSCPVSAALAGTEIKLHARLST